MKCRVVCISTCTEIWREIETESEDTLRELLHREGVDALKRPHDRVEYDDVEYDIFDEEEDLRLAAIRARAKGEI